MIKKPKGKGLASLIAATIAFAQVVLIVLKLDHRIDSWLLALSPLWSFMIVIIILLAIGTFIDKGPTG